MKLLMSIPGIGKTFAPLIFVEIWDINRFRGYEKLGSYAGLVPRTYTSGNRVYHGRRLNCCNNRKEIIKDSIFFVKR